MSPIDVEPEVVEVRVDEAGNLSGGSSRRFVGFTARDRPAPSPSSPWGALAAISVPQTQPRSTRLPQRRPTPANFLYLVSLQPSDEVPRRFDDGPSPRPARELWSQRLLGVVLPDVERCPAATAASTASWPNPFVTADDLHVDAAATGGHEPLSFSWAVAGTHLRRIASSTGSRGSWQPSRSRRRDVPDVSLWCPMRVPLAPESDAERCHDVVEVVGSHRTRTPSATSDDVGAAGPGRGCLER